MDYFVDYHLQKSMDIKEEATEASFSLLSPPVTPPSYPLPSVTTASRRRGSTSLAANRPRPYAVPDRHTIPIEATTMSTTSSYGPWSTAGSRNGHGRVQQHPSKRSADREDQSAFAIPQYMNEQYMTLADGSSDIPSLATSSSLSGAMGDASLVSHSRHSRSPESSGSGHMYSGNVQNHDMAWAANNQAVSIAMSGSAYPAMPGHGSLSFQTLGSSQMNMVDMNDFTTTRNVSPDSAHSRASLSPYNLSSGTQLPSQIQDGNPMNYGAMVPSYSPPSISPEEEVRRLRRRVRELEHEASRARSALDTMRNAASSGSGLPTARSAAFQSGWKARTEARKRVFCSLNRAGNALCAWHDSRRERRAFPPRNAPPGFLNCGCTHEQALFEESLSRHGVGSYLPGESVRMDPALRNPLLALLEKRYGYKDGDFEHDPISETWNEGDSPAAWEQKAQSGAVVRRRADPERH